MKVPIYFLFVFFFSFSVLAQRSVQLSADGGLALGNYAGWTGSAGISLPKGFLFSFQYDNLKRERKGLFPNITIVDSLSESNLRTVLVYSAIKAYAVLVGKKFDLTGTDEFLLSFEGGISELKTTLPSTWQQINDLTFGTILLPRLCGERDARVHYPTQVATTNDRPECFSPVYYLQYKFTINLCFRQRRIEPKYSLAACECVYFDASFSTKPILS